MATRLLSKEFEDIFGNVTTFYRANAVDKVTSRFVIENAIETKSIDSNYYTVDNGDSTITRLSGDWENDGFRVGQTILLRNPDITTITTTIVFIYDNVIGVTPGDLSTLTSTIETFGTVDYVKITATTHHDCCDIALNFVQNGGGNNTSSLIDGENTILRFSGLEALAVSGSVVGVQVGHKSGQFKYTGIITLDSEVSDVRKYTFELITIQNGIYLPLQFAGSGCLKPIFQFAFQVVEGEPYGNSIVYYNEDADTGYLNEAFNTGIIDATVTDSFTSLDYGSVSTKQFKIDSPESDRYICAVYLPLDNTYFKNNDFSQSELTMMLDSHVPYSDTTYSSFVNGLGASYTMSLDTVSTTGTETTYELVMTPNSNFNDFIDSRLEGDRRFIVFFRCGSVNLVLFDGQLTKAPQEAGDIDVDSSGFIKHNNNTHDSGVIPAPIQYTESDMAFFMKFRLLKEDVYDRMVSVIEAYNPTTNDAFELEKVIFDFSNVQISNDGVYLFDETVGRNNNLPSNSAKKQATLVRYDSLDITGAYGVKFYYPYINRWEYWLAQPNADVTFYPNQNKNWQKYSAHPDWLVRIRTYLQKGDLSYQYSGIIPISDFDSGNFTTTIQLFRENGDPVNAVVNGEIMTIKATHTALTTVNIEFSWGHIKIEQKENSPAWWITSILGNGGDTNNPLSDFVMTTIGNQLIFECKFDTTKLDTTGGVSISSEADSSDEFEEYWETTDGDTYTEAGTTDKWKII